MFHFCTQYMILMSAIILFLGEFWGNVLEDGSWTGLVGILKRREADIGVANMFISSFRKVVIDYTAPYNSDVIMDLLL